MCVCVYGEHVCTITHMWKSEDNSYESVVPFYPMGPGVEFKLLGLVASAFYPLSHLAGHFSF